jgi:hypothetical protein
VIDTKELEFESHRQRSVQLFDKDKASPETREYFARSAVRSHINSVHDCLRDEQLRWISVAHKLATPEAEYFALYGAARRAGILWAAYRGILGVVDVDRTKPLKQSEVAEVSRDLNVIYISLVGTIDNCAWCLLHERGSPEVRGLGQTAVGLFGKKFIGNACFANLRPAVERYRPWFEDLRRRRDPAAHRIPLSAPPSALDSKDAERYTALENEIGRAFERRDFAECDRLRDEQEKIGRLVPFFLHHPNEPRIPFYPTIPQDLGTLIQLCQAVRDFLQP